MSDRLKAKAGLIARDIECILRGDYEEISEDSRRELAEFLRDRLDDDGQSVEIPLTERVTLIGRREDDGTVLGSLKIDF
ncbi:MAG: hypothetical protein AAGC55_23680 [Myxococcota bacterium]